MSLHPLVCADAAVAASQNSQVLEFVFVGNPPDTTGTALDLIPAQAVAQHRVYLGIGGTDSVESAMPGTEAVEALIKRPNGNTLSATEQAIAVGVQTLISDMSLNVDGVESVVFAVGGLNARDVVCAELHISATTWADAQLLSQTGAVTRIPEPVALVNGGGFLRLKLADGSGAELASNNVQIVAVGGELNGSCSTVVGCFKNVSAAALSAITSDTRLTLRLTVRN